MEKTHNAEQIYPHNFFHWQIGFKVFRSIYCIVWRKMNVCVLWMLTLHLLCSYSVTFCWKLYSSINLNIQQQHNLFVSSQFFMVKSSVIHNFSNTEDCALCAYFILIQFLISSSSTFTISVYVTLNIDIFMTWHFRVHIFTSISTYIIHIMNCSTVSAVIEQSQ